MNRSGWRASPLPYPTTSTAAAWSCDPRCQRRGRGLVIAERERAVANDLPGLVSLPRDQQRVPRLQIEHGGFNRLGAVADLASAFSGCENGGADRSRIFAARVVVGDDD